MNSKFVKLSDIDNFLYIEDFFDETQLKDILNEIDFVTNDENKLYWSGVKNSGTAKDKNANLLAAKKKLLQLDNFYHFKKIERNVSAYFQYHKKCSKALPTSNFVGVWNYLNTINNNYTALAKYKNNSYYDAHSDSSVFTQLVWINKPDHIVQGGDLIFEDFNHRVPYKNNTCILFPGYFRHSITKVIAQKKHYRYCFITFYTIEKSER